jgi:ATP synthase F1 complex assembly factor 2
MRRFWKTVNLTNNAESTWLSYGGSNAYLSSDDVLVKLDHRDLKTPGGTKLVVPKNRRLLALLIANEWENQSAVLKQHSLPVVSQVLIAARLSTDRRPRLYPELLMGWEIPRHVKVLSRLSCHIWKRTRSGMSPPFGSSTADKLSFQEDSPRTLVKMQKEHWDPLFAWVKEDLGVDLALAEGLAPARQSEATNKKMTEVLQEMDVWELAGAYILCFLIRANLSSIREGSIRVEIVHYRSRALPRQTHGRASCTSQSC